MAKSASDKYTVNYQQIMSIPIGTRVKFAQGGFLDAFLSELTPGQRVAMFPDYYKEKISGGAGAGGIIGGGGTIDNITKETAQNLDLTPGEVNRTKKTLNVDDTVIDSNKYTNVQVEVMKFARRWGISPQAAAGVLRIESGIRSDIQGGAKNNFYGVFQLQGEQIAGLTEKAGFGKLSPEQYRKLSIGDQLKVMDEYYKQWGVEPGFFTGDPAKDAAKMWALQLSPSLAKKINYDDPNAVISKTDQASTIEAKNGLVTVGSAGAGSLPGGEEYLSDTPTATPLPSENYDYKLVDLPENRDPSHMTDSDAEEKMKANLPYLENTAKLLGKTIKVRDAVAQKGTSRETETPGSQHFHGNAFDIDTTGLTNEEKRNLLTYLKSQGFTGFGLGLNTLHADRGKSRAWNYGNDTWAGMKISDALSYAKTPLNDDVSKIISERLKNIEKDIEEARKKQTADQTSVQLPSIETSVAPTNETTTPEKLPSSLKIQFTGYGGYKSADIVKYLPKGVTYDSKTGLFDVGNSEVNTPEKLNEYLKGKLGSFYNPKISNSFVWPEQSTVQIENPSTPSPTPLYQGGKFDVSPGKEASLSIGTKPYSLGEPRNRETVTVTPKFKEYAAQLQLDSNAEQMSKGPDNEMSGKIAAMEKMIEEMTNRQNEIAANAVKPDNNKPSPDPNNTNLSFVDPHGRLLEMSRYQPVLAVRGGFNNVYA